MALSDCVCAKSAIAPEMCAPRVTARLRLSAEEQDEAFAALCGDDLTANVKASKRLSGDPSTTRRLLRVLEHQNRPEVRQGILYALAWHDSLASWEVAVRVVADPAEAPRVRVQAAEILAYHFKKLWPGGARFESAAAASVSALNDPSPEVRNCAVFALGSTGHLPLLPALERMLSDNSPVPGWIGTVASYAAEQIEWLRGTAKRRASRSPPFDEHSD